MDDEVKKQEVKLMQGNAVVVVNLDELSDDLAEYLKNGLNVDIGNTIIDTSQLQDLLHEINSKIPKSVDLSELLKILNDLNIFVKDLGYKIGAEGKQKIYGDILEVPAIKGEYKIDFKVREDGFITGISYSQSSWRYEDNWCVDVNNERLLNNVYTKEYGEYKGFSNIYPIIKDESISFIYNNNSGTNKIVWVDFELLEKENNVL